MSFQLTAINDPSNYGLSTAWILATVGSKKASKKMYSSDLRVSISRTCDSIANPQVGLALRLLSNLLYGVSLLYKRQVDDLWNDTSAVNSRLMRDFDNKYRALLPTETPTMVQTSSQLFFSNDKYYLLEESFSRAFEPQIDPRRTEILRLESIHQGTEEPTFAAIPEETVFGIDDIDFSLADTMVFSPEPAEMEDVSFVFNEDGNAINLSFEHSAPRQEQIQHDMEPLQTLLDPHFSTTSDALDTHGTVLATAQSVVVTTSRKHRLEVDTNVVLPPDVFGGSIREDSGEAKDSQLSLAALIGNCSKTSPPFLNLVYKQLFSLGLTRNIDSSRLPNKRRHLSLGISESLMRAEDEELENPRRAELPQPRHELELLGDISGLDFGNVGDILESRDTTFFEEDIIEPEEPEESARLGRFLTYIQTMSAEHGRSLEEDEVLERKLELNCEDSGSYSEIRLDKIIVNDGDVLRRVAAKSFMSVLELATSNIVSILARALSRELMCCSDIKVTIQS